MLKKYKLALNSDQSYHLSIATLQEAGLKGNPNDMAHEFAGLGAKIGIERDNNGWPIMVVSDLDEIKVRNTLKKYGVAIEEF